MKINEGAISIGDLLKRNPIVKDNKRRGYEWQELALEIIKGLTDGKDYKGSIFKACKLNRNYAEKCFNDCKELNKPFSKYFFKIFNKH